MHEVNQQQLGNCWFLASICAILATTDGPARIQQMMIEDDSYVYVRLYDCSHRPHCIKLEKSVIHSLSGNEYHAKLEPSIGSWPVFLEKALTAFDRDMHFAPKTAYYGRTASGTGLRGLTLLLGIDVLSRPIRRPALAMANPSHGKFWQNLIFLLDGSLDINTPSDLTTITKIFGATPQAKWANFKAWTKTHPNLGRELVDEFDSRKTKTRTLSVRKTGLPDSETILEVAGVFRVEHFLNWFDRRCGLLDHQLATCVCNWVRTSGVLPGKRGTGIYSAEQEDLFHYMLGLHLAKIPMTVGTTHYMGMQSGGVPTYVDDTVRGLAPKHEYAVTKVYRSGGLCLIELVNPWGTVGRGFANQAPHFARQNAPVIETSSGIFSIDLDDLTKRFDAVCHTVEPCRPLDS
jgi:hypothetical protein